MHRITTITKAGLYCTRECLYSGGFSSILRKSSLLFFVDCSSLPPPPPPPPPLPLPCAATGCCFLARARGKREIFVLLFRVLGKETSIRCHWKTNTLATNNDDGCSLSFPLVIGWFEPVTWVCLGPIPILVSPKLVSGSPWLEAEAFLGGLDMATFMLLPCTM